MSSKTETAGESRETVPPDLEDETIEREIGHDEFNPVGTLALVLVYFVIIGALWVFMYFVEFLGRGPTVV